jgi:hypothetical protein
MKLITRGAGSGRSPETVTIWAIYAGTSGRQHGDANDRTPAAKAMRRLRFSPSTSLS